ncbi:24100_t:CDS:2, partial [Cetraspora pellucida]
TDKIEIDDEEIDQIEEINEVDKTDKIIDNAKDEIKETRADEEFEYIDSNMYFTGDMYDVPLIDDIEEDP